MSFLVTILASKSNEFSLAKDVEGLRRVFGSSKYSVRHCDPLEPPSYSDLAIHLEVPAFGWTAWSAKNCLVVNPDLYEAAAWNSYLCRFDNVVTKDRTALAEFKEIVGEKAIFIPWAAVPVSSVDTVQRFQDFTNAWRNLVPIQSRPAELKYLPPKLEEADCPPISVVTLIYNRKKFFDLACHSMMVSDYPKDKIEWVIVDDSDDPAEQNSDRIVAVGNDAAPMKFVYVPLKRKTPVSEKRNLGVAAATNEVVLFVDDDDHYPQTSFRRRVAWLTLHPWRPKVVAATTIACYDLIKGISAVNVPPHNIPLAQRISEATLTFYKSFWAERGFPKDIVVGEGEGFIQGREGSFLEIPPQHVIVAFSHGKNVSSRRVPSDVDVKPGCFWGFPKEFLVFVHGLAGISIIDKET